MSKSGQIKAASDVSERVSTNFRQGRSEEALSLLEREYGPQARALMERVMTQYNLDDNQMSRLFEKVSEVLEHAADKTAKFERLENKTIKEVNRIKAAEEAARVAAYREAQEAKQKAFEERLEKIRQEYKKLDKEEKNLDKEEAKRRKELAKEKRIEKRRQIEARLQQIEERKRVLRARRQQLEADRQRIQAGGTLETPEKTGNSTPAKTTTITPMLHQGNSR